MTGKKGRNGEVSEVITGEWLEKMGGILSDTDEGEYKFLISGDGWLCCTPNDDPPVVMEIRGNWLSLPSVLTCRDFSDLYFRLSGKRLEVVKNE